jgi:Uma2 family endonuclease
MSTAESETAVLRLCPGAAGVGLAPSEFDAAEIEEGYRYELIRGVLIVTPSPLAPERGSNDRLGHWLRAYQENHPQGLSLDATLPEHEVFVGDDRRRVDRVVWIGLGRRPRVEETPTIVVEFVPEGKKDLLRDYQHKRREYAAIGVQEYWGFNRFNRTLTVFRPSGEFVFGENETYTTPLLPGFKLPLAKLFEVADRWDVNG